MLGCIEVPSDRGLEGHSDGDVVTHALCDAILGAAGVGDLGRHFPSSAGHWRGASGHVLLARSVEIAAEGGLLVTSAQVVAIAEQPALAPHLEAMTKMLAGVAGLVPGTISVGATSTDGLGFAGRGEGIAATAVALLAPIS